MCYTLQVELGDSLESDSKSIPHTESESESQIFGIVGIEPIPIFSILLNKRVWHNICEKKPIGERSRAEVAKLKLSAEKKIDDEK